MFFLLMIRRPPRSTLSSSSAASDVYKRQVYICHNNTIYGTTYKELPEVGDKILVADMSSDFLSEPVDVSKFGLIFAGAQKNVGPAGTVIVIIREDLIAEDVLPGTPTMLRYKIHADNKSLYNTCLLYTSPSPRDRQKSRMPSSA
eukprot:TRINITY_DN13309_c0_g1_i4.p2 TRINITY_DN13309_c0_g1~~TRINITY_DN13309_c0_g1_i4.p2  ORF type:complete len:145 (+),score=34.27 TRINITY_DN13309_c0_g1_i4:81-515(+)